MNNPSDEIKSLIAEMFDQSDRATAIVAATIIDELLGRCLLGFMREDKQAKELLLNVYKPLSSLKAKTDLAYMLGLLTDDERSDIEIIRKIRNDFAHKFDNRLFTTPDVKALCGKMLGFKNSNPPKEMPPISGIDLYRFCATKLTYRLNKIANDVSRVTSFDLGISES